MDRRTSQRSDTGHRRRDSDRAFALLREKILLGLGSLIVVGLSVAAVFGNIHSTDVAFGCLTVGAGLLGAPSFLRWDERRGRR